MYPNQVQTTAMGIDSSDNPILAGYFSGTIDFDPGEGEVIYSGEWPTTYLSKFSNDGILDWSVSFGGGPLGLNVDSHDNVLVTGLFDTTTDFDPGPDDEEYTPIGPADIFLSKFDEMGIFRWVLVYGGEDMSSFWDEAGVSVTTDNELNIYTTGQFQETCDFMPGDGIYELTSNGNLDAYLVKFTPDGTW